jgi:hypothetical protein
MSDPGAPPFLFVVGCGRSGTTVLRTILDSHPDLAMAHEGRFIAPLIRRRARYERADGFAVDVLAADLLADRAVRTNLHLDADDVRAALGPPAPSSCADAVRRIFAYYAAREGKARYGDKMPGYVVRMPALAELLPEARFVHIIRDGRDVALSSMAIETNRDGVVAHALSWKRRVEAGRTAGRRLGPARYHDVRYEDLIEDPAAHVSALCRFAGLSYEPAMLRFFERADAVPAKVRANPRHARLREPLSTGTRSWRTHMGAADVQRFEVVAGELLTELGYPRGAPEVSLAARAQASWGWLHWQLRRGAARLPGMARRALVQDP